MCAELHVQHCNDFFSVGNGAWSAISCVKSLRRLAIEDQHCRLDADSLKELASLPQVRTPVHQHKMYLKHMIQMHSLLCCTVLLLKTKVS